VTWAWRTVAVLVGASVTLGACGPDRDRTRENVIEDLEQYGPVDARCVGSVLDTYSDEELAALDREARAITDPENTSPTVSPSEGFRTLYTRLFECVSTTTG